MKADNNSLTNKDRDHLKTIGYNLLVRPSHLEFLKYMEASANPANIELMIKGMQSVPKVYGNTGFEIRLWDHIGTFETPWFGGYYQEKYYKSDRDHHYVLELPDNLSEQVGDGKLVIELEVDIREEEGWLEEVMLPMLPILKDGLPPSIKANNECLRKENQLTASKEEAGNV